MKSQADVFINRELSWIEFNKRVLLTGMEKEYKILDKVKFCSIFSNNLDEFFMVRVASLTVSYTHLTLPTIITV